MHKTPCAYQKVDPLANWHVPTGNIRLAGRQTLTAWRVVCARC